MSSDWWHEEINALFETEEDKECMLTEFDHCNSENQSSSVAGANTFFKTKKDYNNENENTKERLTAWLLMLVVFFLLWTSMLTMFS